MRKTALKLLIIGPIFFSNGPAAHTSPELNFHIINMSQDSSRYLSTTHDLYIVEAFARRSRKKS